MKPARRDGTLGAPQEVPNMGRNILARSLRAGSARQMELSVEAGQVVCPARGVVDIETCFACRSYQGLHDGRSERLVCTPRASSELAIVPFGFVPR
jgi:hypothetical protein